MTHGGPSFVVDPADGRVPMQAWAEAQRAQNRASPSTRTRSASSRACRVTLHGPVPFLQTPTRLVQLSEETNAFRNIVLMGARTSEKTSCSGKVIPADDGRARLWLSKRETRTVARGSISRDDS